MALNTTIDWLSTTPEGKSTSGSGWHHRWPPVLQIFNRLRGLLTQIHPALERVLGPRLAHPAVVDLLGRYPTPAGLKRAGRGHVRARLKKLAPRMAARLTDEIFRALAEQTTIVTGTHAAEHIIGRLAAQLQQLTQQRSDVEARNFVGG